MSTNCLVTKLKGSVENESLPVLNAIKIELKSSQQVIYISLNTITTVKLIGNAVFTSSDGSQNYGKEYTDTSCYIKNINDGDFLFIYGKYDLSNIYTEDNKVFIKDNYPLDLDYCGEITRLQIGNRNLVNIDLNKFSKYNTKVTYIRNFYNNNIYGDLETIAENMLANGRDGSVANDILCIGTDSTNLKLNGVKTANDYNTINFISSSSIIIYAGENKTSGTVVASYDGSTWTYS